MAPVAAIGGVKRGVAKARKNANIRVREDMAQNRRAAAQRYAKETEVVKKLMEAYDKDKSGFWEPDDIKQMLTDQTFSIGQSKIGRVGLTPTKDELDCLISLCDREHNGKISCEEVLGATTTWCAYMEKGAETHALLQKHDLSGTGKINHGELRPLLAELNDGSDVPDDVLKWVWEQADLIGDGCLGQFELTRAIAAWYVWLPEEQPGGSPGMIAGQMDRKAMPEQKPAQSACCVVS